MLKRTALLLMVLFAIIIIAQPIDAKSRKNKRSDTGFHKGMYALQFGLSKDYQLESYDNSLVGIKRFSTDHSGWSLAFLFDLNDDEVKSIRTTSDPDTTLVLRDRDYDDVDSDIKIELKYFHYLSANNDVKAYFGIGPLFSYYNRQSKGRESWGTVTQDKRRTTRYGLGAALGGEWFVRDNISFMVEYKMNASYYKNENKSERVNPNGNIDTYIDDRSGYDFNSSRADFGVSIYF